MKKFLKWSGVVLLVALVAGAVYFFVFLPPQVGSSMNGVTLAGPYAIPEKAKALHDTLFVADLHGDSLLWGRDILVRASWGHVDVPRMQEGNMALQAFTVVTKTPAGMKLDGNSADARDNITLLALSLRWPKATWTSLKARALYQADLLHDAESRSNGMLRVVKTREDLERFEADRLENPRLIAGFLGIEGGHCLEGELENVDVMYDAGFRMIGITHFFDNELGGSAHGVSKAGLTPFGIECVKRMEELNITVDLAHASPKVIDDVLAMATRPVLVSHTGVKGTCDNQRNMTDAHIQGVAKTGGIIGLGLWDTAVCGTDAAATARAIRYVADLVGAEHVALGSDNDGAIQAHFDISGIALMTDALLAEGFSDEEIRLMMGGNALRFFKKNFPSEKTETKTTRAGA